MSSLRSYIKNITPNFVRAYFWQTRRALRSLLRSFMRVAECNVNGILIKVGISSEMEQFRAETYSTKEPETIDWLNQNLQDCDVFFDVGANIGLYSLYAAKLCPRCRIYSFEPESQNYARLCNNIVLNAITNIIPCNFPLSDRETFDLFCVGEMQPGSALHSFGQLNDFRENSDAVSLKQGALSTTLDTLVAKYGVPQPTLLKIDVDGIEDKILDGAEAVLRSQELRSILVELSFKDEAGITDTEQKLTRLGYKLLIKSNWIWEQKGLKSQNYIFGRK